MRQPTEPPSQGKEIIVAELFLIFYPFILLTFILALSGQHTTIL